LAVAPSVAPLSWSVLSLVLSSSDLALELVSDVLSADFVSGAFGSDLVLVLVSRGLEASVWSARAELAVLSFAELVLLRLLLRELSEVELAGVLLARCGCEAVDDWEEVEESAGVTASSSAAKLSPDWGASARLDFGAAAGMDGLTGISGVTLTTLEPLERTQPRQFSKERAKPVSEIIHCKISGLWMCWHCCEDRMALLFLPIRQDLPLRPAASTIASPKCHLY
jgi:hypothetical protein